MENGTLSIAGRQAQVLPDRIKAAAVLFTIGAVIIFGAGLASSEVVHNAAHDTRHAIGFPCH
jgi:cobalt transporter subunit CbtB